MLNKESKSEDDSKNPSEKNPSEKNPSKKPTPHDPLVLELFPRYSQTNIIPKKKFKCCITWQELLPIIGCFFIEFSLGASLTTGNTIVYIISYLRSTDVDISYMDCLWFPCLNLAGISIGTYVGDRIYKKFGVFPTNILGSIIFCTFIFFTSVSIKIGSITTFISYGFLSSCGVGISSISLHNYKTKSYTTFKYFTNALVVFSFSFGGFCIVLVQTFYINPNNKTPDVDGYFSNPDIIKRIPFMFVWMGIYILIINLIGLLFLQSDVCATRQHKINKIRFREFSASPPKMVRTNLFCILWIVSVLNYPLLQYYSVMQKVIGIPIIKNDHQVSIVTAFAIVMNVCSHYFWNITRGTCHFKTCMLINLALVALTSFSFLVILKNSEAIYTILTLFIMFIGSGTMTLYPLIIEDLFGTGHLRANICVFSTGAVLSSALNVHIIQIIDNFGGSSAIYSYLGLLNVCGYFLMRYFPKDETW